jgi:DNA-binding response OmpR family regulator
MTQVVLVVESNNHAGKLFKSCLERDGYYTVATNDANKALKLAHAWQPGLVMVDMHLADNATEWLIKSIRNTPDNPPRIVLTVCGNLEKTSTLASQVDAVIPKPLDCWQIAAVISELLNWTACISAKGEFTTSVDRRVKHVSASPAA